MSSHDLASSHKLTQEQVDLVKRTIARGATDDELALFLYYARRTGLDPLSRQIHFVRRWDADLGREVGTIQTGIDGLRLIAARTGLYRPDPEAPRYAFKEDGTPQSARVRVHVYHPETQAWYPVEAEAFYEEYVQRKRDGIPTRAWARMPKLMLAKCAEALALRKAFPAELSGIYAHEEMGTETSDPRPLMARTNVVGHPAGLPECLTERATTPQRKRMHMLWKGRHKLPVESFRRWLEHRYRVTSTGDLSDDQATEVIEFLTTVSTADIVRQLASVSRTGTGEIPAEGPRENTGGTNP
jgi:phage recombination protein Bet